LPPRTETPSSSSERDARGRFLQGHVGVSPGRPPRDELRELYIDDLFAIWKIHGRKVIKQLAEENPGAFLRVMVSLVRKMRRLGDD
jgi:hypothetical protein